MVVGNVAIIGLLFGNADGDRTCVGQIRPDCLGHTFNDVKKMNLGFKRVKTGPYLKAIAFHDAAPSEDDAELAWIECVTKGCLEWWFTVHQTQIHYAGQDSLSMW